MAGNALAYFGSLRWRRATSPIPSKVFRVPADFLGLCVANAPERECDDYVISRLNELGIRQARLDFTYGDRDAFTERFLSRLLTERFRVCLHLVQPREEALAMLRNPEAAKRWRNFIGDMLDRYGSRAELIEIGSTCNRRKWSGYDSPAAFFAAWQIAWEEARGRNLAIAGPNVTDFEPLYNAGWLGELRRTGMLPSVHTDNLFVERSTEPEAFDHKIAGRRLAGLLRFNLVRKAQLLQDIGAWAGVPTLMCTHVTWSLRRIARFLEDVEEKQADYLARYACLAAASGAFTRVYWGPLIGQREGLIDDGTSEYPELPHVTYYEQARGKLKDYRLRPAFRTFQNVNRLLTGATFLRQPVTGPGLEILEFECTDDGGRTPDNRHQTTDAGQQSMDNGVSRQNSPAKPETPQSEIENLKSKILHAVWTTDGNGAGADACYPPELLAQAEIYDRDGKRLERAPRMFSESPVFLLWPESTWNAQREALSAYSSGDAGQKSEPAPRSTLYVPRPSTCPGFRFAHRPGWDFDTVRAETNALGLAGIYLTENDGKHLDIQALLETLSQSKAEDRRQKADDGKQKEESEKQKSTILRAARNTVWSVEAPWNSEQTIVIKAFKRRSIFRRLLDHGKPNKALRSWNGAQELLRRGLHTPTPLACLAPENVVPGKANHDATSYYICEAFAPAWSVRDVFTAFSSGATAFKGQAANAWFAAISIFLQKLHTRGVYFRDLSAGNLLVRQASAPLGTPVGELEFALIDTARARFYPHSLGLRLRLCDLMRICHPLDWPNRHIFVEQYLAHNGRRFNWWMKIPFWHYDTKHRIKNALKKIRS